MKFAVTPELALLIKTLRNQNAVASKDLANSIGRSASYMSKLESGGVKKIADEDLRKILTAVTRRSDFFDEVLPSAVRTFRAAFPDEKLYDQIWLLTYDVLERTVVVPERMADELSDMAGQCDLDPTGIAEGINENRDSDAPAGRQVNSFYLSDKDGEKRLMLRVHITTREVERVLEGGAETGYHTVYTVTWFLVRSLKFGGVKTKLPQERAVEVLRDTAVIMEKYGMETLTQFDRMLFSPGFMEKQTHKMSALDSVSARLMEEIVAALGDVSKYDAISVADTLEAFLKNLKWDPSFTMKVAQMPFSELGDLGYTQKKELIDKIDKLIEDYNKMPEVVKKMEIY